MFCPERPPAQPRGGRHQHGITLIEVLVGLVIGLIAVASAVQALSTLQVAQSETTLRLRLQADARQVLNNIAQEIRLAGAAHLTSSASGEARLTDAPYPFIHAATQNGQATLSLSYANPSATSNAGCLWRRTSGLGSSVSSLYSVSEQTLRCNGNGLTQPLIDNVAEFTTRLATQSGLGLQWQNADQANLNRVVGIAVCLHVFSDPVNTAAPSTQTGCDGGPVPADGRLHWVEWRVTSIRSAQPL
jgi:type IV pilus assembly protein PilW